MTMRQFKVRQDRFKEIKKQIFIRTLPIMLIAVIGGIVISSINSKDKKTDISILPIIIPLIGVSVGVGLYRGVNRQKKSFDSFTLTLTNNLITREQLNTPTVSIYFNDIKEIVKNKNGSYAIKGKGATDIINIPSQVENYNELELALDKIKPVTTKGTEPILQKYRILLSLLTIGLMLCVYTVTNKILVAASGTLLVGLMLWSFYEVRRSKNIDIKTKRSMWWILLVLFSVIGVMIIKLTGFTKQ